MYTESHLNISNEDEHLLITYYIQDLAMCTICEEIVPYIILSAGKNDDRTGNIKFCQRSKEI